MHYVRLSPLVGSVRMDFGVATYLNWRPLCASNFLIAIRAEPHINSKIHVWKKYYSSLIGMMGKSGFGWDDSRSMVTVSDDTIWEEYCKLDPTVRTMHYKSWPFFPVWREIFGKDRASGEQAEDINEIVNKTDTPENNDHHDFYVPMAEWCPESGFTGNDIDHSPNTQGHVDPTVNSTTSNKKSTSTTKKRKMMVGASDDGLVVAVNTFCETANTRLGELAKKLFVDYEEVEKRSGVYEAVGNSGY
ncbi:UNVERIFIED_CONTAM: hypothetical protein Sradi_6662700 [Sesamum radiatum]|uniref:Myb/SANT-like domain-containing protein n=1 Tax=Sesamum radiatum TaxID=300843 RepID=A0AAW2JPE8_SESRA